jgi:hypothetical protein
MRTTVDIDDLILKDLKRLQASEGKSLGRLISDLLAQALSDRRAPNRAPTQFRWIAKPMGAKIDPTDKDALLDATD